MGNTMIVAQRPIPRFSIAIPAYKERILLARALVSLSVQSVKDIEIIVSDDSKSAVIRDLVLSIGDDRIKYIENAHPTGAVDNWNRCLDQCSGEYVILMHHDECFAHSNCLAEIYKCFTDRNTSIVISNLILESAECGNRRYGLRWMKWLFANFISDCFVVYNPIGPVSVLAMRRSDLIGKFDNRFKWLVDVEYYRRIFTGRKTRICTQSTVLSHLDHPHKITSSRHWDKIECFERALILEQCNSSWKRLMLVAAWRIINAIKCIKGVFSRRA